MLECGNLKKASELLPKSVTQATKEPPICDVIKVVGNGAVVRYIEFELVRMSALVSVGNNLNDGQVQFIATQLVEMFPNESLADFKICFERGCMGQYNRTKKEDIFRMDGIVLRQWMEQYLEEKYQVIETELMKEKDEHYKVIIPENSERDWLKEWQESIKSNDGPKGIVPLTDSDIRKEGQEKPIDRIRRGTGHVFNEADASERLKRHKETVRRCQEQTIRERYPDASEEEIQSYIKQFEI